MARPHVFQPLLRQQSPGLLLVNETLGVVLARSIETAFDSRARRTGLLGRETFAAGTVLAIAPSSAVHTFGMRFPIDVLFINRAGRVVKRALGVKPGRITGTLTAFAALEFAAGALGVAWTAVGDQLKLIER
jgi:uncharacterized membrane protein (UPF0127 family)